MRLVVKKSFIDSYDKEHNEIFIIPIYFDEEENINKKKQEKRHEKGKQY